MKHINVWSILWHRDRTDSTICWNVEKLCSMYLRGLPFIAGGGGLEDCWGATDFFSKCWCWILFTSAHISAIFWGYTRTVFHVFVYVEIRPHQIRYSLLSITRLFTCFIHENIEFVQFVSLAVSPCPWIWCIKWRSHLTLSLWFES